MVHNKTVPLSILKILASDADNRVRFFVATKRKLDLELFEKLAYDTDSSVRHRIAYNAKTPIEILKKLANDNSEMVASVAKERLGKIEGGNNI